MASGPEIAKGQKQYNANITWFLVLSSIVAATGGIIYGYDIGVSGGVTSMDSFLNKFFPTVYNKMKKDSSTSNYCKFDSQLLTTFTSSLYLAGLIASFFASPVTRRFGRKTSILIGGAAFLTGAALNGAAQNVYMLIFGRVFLGIGIGFANQSIPLYLSEIAPPLNRGAFNMAFQVCVGLGGLAASLINYGTEKIHGGWGWRISLAMAGVPALMITIGSLILPETPVSLIERGKDYEKARQLLQRIRGTPSIDEEFDDLIRASECSKTVQHPFKNLMQRKYRPQLVMSLAIPFFQQLTGINVISFYAPLLFRTIGLGESASLLASVGVTGVVGTITTFLSLLIVDKVGRKVLFTTGGIVMLVTQITIGGIMAAQLGNHGGMSKGYGIAVLMLICTYVAGFGISWGPLGWLVPSEIFPLEIRSAAQSTTVAAVLFFTALVAQTFLAMLCHMKAGIFFFFGGWVALMTVFIHFLLPETKNVPIEKMEQIWGEHWFWKKFVNTQGNLVENQGYKNRCA